MKGFLRIFLIYAGALLLGIILWNVIITHGMYSIPSAYYSSGIWKSYYPHALVTYGLEGYGRNTFDSAGFNNDAIRPRSGAFRIVVLGDSYTEAIHVARSQNYCGVLQKELGPRAEVINLGATKRSIADYLALAPEIVSQQQPNLTLIQVTSSDFLSDSFNKWHQFYLTDTNGTLALQTHQPSTNRGSLFKQKYQHLIPPVFLYSYLRFNNLRSSGAKKGFEEEAADADNGQYSDPVAAERVIRWELTELKKKYGQVGLIYFAEVPKLQQGKIITAESGAAALVFPMLQRLCQEYGIHLISMAEAFNNLYTSQHRFARGFSNTTPSVGHLNVYGHEVVGREVAKNIQSLLTVKENNEGAK